MLVIKLYTCACKLLESESVSLSVRLEGLQRVQHNWTKLTGNKNHLLVPGSKYESPKCSLSNIKNYLTRQGTSWSNKNWWLPSNEKIRKPVGSRLVWYKPGLWCLHLGSEGVSSAGGKADPEDRMTDVSAAFVSAFHTGTWKWGSERRQTLGPGSQRAHTSSPQVMHQRFSLAWDCSFGEEYLRHYFPDVSSVKKEVSLFSAESRMHQEGLLRVTVNLVN